MLGGSLREDKNGGECECEKGKSGRVEGVRS